MFGIEIKNLNRALMLLATAVIVLMAVPPISALAKDNTAKQLASPRNSAQNNIDSEMQQASR